MEQTRCHLHVDLDVTGMWRRTGNVTACHYDIVETVEIDISHDQPSLDPIRCDREPAIAPSATCAQKQLTDRQQGTQARSGTLKRVKRAFLTRQR